MNIVMIPFTVIFLAFLPPSFPSRLVYLLFLSLSVCVSVCLTLISWQLLGGVLLEGDHTAAGQTSLDALPLHSWIDRKMKGGNER